MSHICMNIPKEISKRDLEKALCRKSLWHFVKHAWPYVESAEFIDNWHIHAICEHLEAVTTGQIPQLLINIPPGCSKPCYNGGMILERTKGRIALSQVIIGDFVLTHRGRFRRVLAVHEQGLLPTLEIQTASGRKMRLEHSHPVLTSRGWVEAQNITESDVLAQVIKAEPCGTDTISSEEARLLGYLIGDGCVKYSAKIFTNQDKETISDFRRCAATVGFQTRVVKKVGKHTTTHNVSLLGGQSHRKGLKRGETKGIVGPVVAWLQSHNLEGKCSYDKRVPEAVMSGTDEIVAEFLAAYWACDGSISDRRDLPRPGRFGQTTQTVRISCTTVSEGLARDIQHLLNRLGLIFILYRHVADIKSKRQGEKYVSWRLTSNQQDTAAKFMNVFRSRLRHDKANRAVNLERTDFDRILIPDRVRSIKESGLGECRCLIIEEDASFAYEDLAVHNSLLVSVFWMCWEWSKDPSIRWFFASYDQRLSTRDSVKCRSLINSSWYRKLFGDMFDLVLDQNQKTYYETDKGGYRMATSVGGHGTGEHPDRIVIDDPHNVQQAESDVERQGILTWWNLTMTTRGVSRRARRVIIMQRLHQDDLSGHVLKEEGWEYLCLPMRYESERMKITSLRWNDPRKEEGELLAPEQFPDESVRKMERTLGIYGTAGQLAQRPAPREGGMFKDWNFNKRERIAPFKAVRVRSWDLAATSVDENRRACFTTGVLMAKSDDGRFFVEDVKRKQIGLDERDEWILSVALADRVRYGGIGPTVLFEEEGGSGGKAQSKYLKRKLAGFHVITESPVNKGSKEMRAIPWADQLAAGNVVIVENEDSYKWDIKAFIDEHCLAKGTRVITMRGEVPIENVTTKDYVITRQGWKRVLRSECTSKKASVCEVVTESGRNITTTLNHPIWVQGCGFKLAGLLRMGDALLPFTEELYSTATRIVRDRQSGDVLSWIGMQQKRDRVLLIRMLPGRQPVYNLEVDESHEFFANELLVHNCVFPNGTYLDQVDAADQALNYLAFLRPAVGVRILQTGGGGAKTMHILVCSRQDLADTDNTVELHPTVLVSISDPSFSTEIMHGIKNLLAIVPLSFLDKQPEDYHGKWEGNGTSPEELLLNREQAKGLWESLQLQKQVIELIVVCDDGGKDRRALSVALAICDSVRGLQRHRVIHKLSDPDWSADKDFKAPNQHVYNLVRLGHSLAGSKKVPVKTVGLKDWSVLS